jgi:hypothetical protein
VLHNGRRATATAGRLGSSGRRKGRQGRIFKTVSAQNRINYLDSSVVENPPETLIFNLVIGEGFF